MKRLSALLAAVLISAGAALTTSADAQAAVSCRRGYFCVWTDANFTGMKIEHSGDDRWWEGDMNNHDSSWANHGVSGPGVKDHVKIYDGRELTGGVTLCLAPGQEVAYNGHANDRGGSHTWTMTC
ncbi:MULTISPECIES: peptidase inhibitor family I36 protein [Streptomyces]|uniref:peptidase inhibitor family I36 protein n=1 Tax=Streptomyces TaxID=1883 RepID=UPI00163C0090|nr:MULTISPECIES: peptidase inhibitor family I36 protein [Streptomyces]MBC2876502.1 peptidase inhibitor family I36 protein [Streptomyces sp. TYQ1024]UBI40821.1 peptidase inhibitor family I36 protein [Streptomyces mobaraensis]